MTSTTPPLPEAPPAPQLRRTPRQKVVAGVCGGLGRHFDLDPVFFRIVIGVLSVTGGLGLIFYGFAWLLLPAEGEEENEARRVLSGRVDGAALTAILLALVGCGVFLSMLGSGGTLGFAMMLAVAASGAAVWSQRRRLVTDPEAAVDPATAQAVAEAPPETKAPPPPESPSWWRDPIVKDGTTGPVPVGYLWGPPGAAEADAAAATRISKTPVPRTAPVRGPRSIGGLAFVLALVAGGLGTALSWDAHPLGTSLQIGLVSALAVFAFALVLSSFLGRTGFGTVFMTVVTAVLLALAAALPKEISTDWARTTWKPASVSALQPRYELGSGVATLDLSALAVPKGTTVETVAEVGAGQLRVVVPKNVTVTLRAEAGLGDLQLPGEPPNDIDVAPDRQATRTLAPPSGVTPAGTLDLTLEVGLGQVEVTRAAS
ncbi:PspC domain-containing protein [Streptomyces purpureus]|uniref:Membrane protein n=1 Tax=Streptomyces purpureus TaxID=1951 RepID=A0A918HF52_9ACTN|nr:PspC domain-containing protein [Streptomyces purpureus]GGT58671.1 membrane protein [Streptomyces purpureus]